MAITSKTSQSAPESPTFDSPKNGSPNTSLITSPLTPIDDNSPVTEANEANQASFQYSPNTEFRRAESYANKGTGKGSVITANKGTVVRTTTLDSDDSDAYSANSGSDSEIDIAEEESTRSSIGDEEDVFKGRSDENGDEDKEDKEDKGKTTRFGIRKNWPVMLFMLVIGAAAATGVTYLVMGKNGKDTSSSNGSGSSGSGSGSSPVTPPTPTPTPTPPTPTPTPGPCKDEPTPAKKFICELKKINGAKKPETKFNVNASGIDKKTAQSLLEKYSLDKAFTISNRTGPAVFLERTAVGADGKRKPYRKYRELSLFQRSMRLARENAKLFGKDVDGQQFFELAKQENKKRVAKAAKKYFGAKSDLHFVKHLIVGRGQMGTNLFGAMYGGAAKKGGATKMKSEEVLNVGYDTGSWNEVNYTLAQPYRLLDSPYLPVNAKNIAKFGGSSGSKESTAEKNAYVLASNLFKAVIASQHVMQMPMLNAVVAEVIAKETYTAEDSEEEKTEKADAKEAEAKAAKKCFNNNSAKDKDNNGGNFLVRIANSFGSDKNCKRNKCEDPSDDATVKISYLCVVELDYASGLGFGRSVGRWNKKDDPQGFLPQFDDKRNTIPSKLESVVLREFDGAKFGPSFMGSTPKTPSSPRAVVNGNDFMLKAGVVAKKTDMTYRLPKVLVYGGGGNATACARKALMGNDDHADRITDLLDPQIRKKSMSAQVTWAMAAPDTEDAGYGELVKNVVDTVEKVGAIHFLSSLKSVEVNPKWDAKISGKNPTAKNNDVNEARYIAIFQKTVAKKNPDGTRDPAVDSNGKQLPPLKVPFDQLVISLGQDRTIMNSRLFPRNWTRAADKTKEGDWGYRPGFVLADNNKDF